MKVGFIGLGIMGSRMAARLVSAGHDVIVHNRTRAKAENLLGLGAKFAPSPADAARDVDVLITVLADPAAVQTTSAGQGGFLHALSGSALWMDCTTVDPGFARQLAVECSRRGLRYLEAPVSGTRDHAHAGSLTFNVGGNEADLDAVRPLLQVMGSRVAHLGTWGTASSLKLVLTHLLGCGMAAFAEAAALGEALGMERAKLFEALGRSPVTAPFLAAEMTKLMAPESEIDFPLHLMTKDLALVTQTAYAAGVAVPLAAATRENYRLAELHGYGASDYSAIHGFLNRRAGG